MSIVRYNGKNILYFNFTTRIFPGVNELEKGVLDSLLKHSGFKPRFEKGILVIIEPDEKAPEKGKNESKRSIDEMLKLIPDIFDVKLLERIVKSDGRSKVVNEAKKQLYKLSVKAEDEELAEKSKLKGENVSFDSSNS